MVVCKATTKKGACPCTGFEAGEFKPDKCKTCAHKAKDHPGASTEKKKVEIAKTEVLPVAEGLVRDRQMSLVADGGAAVSKIDASAVVAKGLVSERADSFAKVDSTTSKPKKSSKKSDDVAATACTTVDDKAEEEAKALKVAEEVKKLEEEARLKKIEEEARVKAEEEARVKAEEEARVKAEEEARVKAEEEARVKAEEEARVKAEKERRQAEEAERARQEALKPAGVGLYVEQAGKGPLVIKEVKEGGSAALDGSLEVGDTITAIDGEAMHRVGRLREVMIGAPGTTVTIAALKSNLKQIEVTLVRKPIVLSR